MKYKKILIFLLLATIVLTLCSCTEPNTESSPTPVPTSSELTAEYMKPGDTYRIFFYYLEQDSGIDDVYDSGSIRDEMSKKLGHELQDKFGINITFMTHQGTWFNEYLSSAATGTPIADMMFAGGPHLMMEQYAWNGMPGSALLALSDYDYVYDFSDDEYWNTSVQQEMCTFDNKLYFFVPLHVGEGMVNLNQYTFYNKRIMSSAGYAAAELTRAAKEGDWTWDYFEQACLAANDPDRDVYAVIMAQENSLVYNLMASNGGDYVKRKEVDGKMVDRFTAGETESVEAWDFFLKLYNQGLVRPNSMGYEVEINLFINGKTAMMMTYLNRADTFYEKMAEDDFGLLPIPKAPGAESYVSTQNWFTPYAIFKNIPNPEGAVEFCSIFFREPYAKSSEDSRMLMDAELSRRLRDEDSIEFAKEALDYSYVSLMMLYQRDITEYMWDSTDIFLKNENTPGVYFASVADAVNSKIDLYLANQ